MTIHESIDFEFRNSHPDGHARFGTSEMHDSFSDDYTDDPAVSIRNIHQTLKRYESLLEQVAVQFAFRQFAETESEKLTGQVIALMTTLNEMTGSFLDQNTASLDKADHFRLCGKCFNLFAQQRNGRSAFAVRKMFAARDHT